MRRLANFETLLASTIASSALLLALVSGGCTLGVAGDDPEPGDPGGDGGGTPPPPTDIPTPAKYTRGSLVPLFELAQQEAKNRIDPFGIPLNDDDFITDNEGFTSVQDKLEEIEAQIEDERGEDLEVFIRVGDDIRADEIPFRGNPTSVASVIGSDNIRKVIVPLGGDTGTPGNEVAVVDPITEDVVPVRVGIKPTRVVVHEDGVAFVCNQYSNYISIIDVAQNALLIGPDGNPVEIATDYYCSDLLLVDNVVGGEQDQDIMLLVANEFRGEVLRYDIRLEEDPLNGDRISNVTVENINDPINEPQARIIGVGPNPIRLRLDDQEEKVYVANGRGGTLAHIDPKQGSVLATFQVGAPAVDALNIDQSVFVPTTTRDRGLLKEDEPTPQDAEANPVNITGVSGSTVQAHQGAMFDDTFSYNFDDLRNGTMQVDRNLSNEQEYYTDDTSPEASFQEEQLVLNGGLPVSAERDFAGDRLFLAHAGTDHVQTLNVNGGTNFRLENAGVDFLTSARPYAMQVVEELVDRDDNDVVFNELNVVAWGGEVLEIYDLDNGTLLQQIDLGFANLGTGAEYPANNVEAGEYLYYNTTWSNDGRKSCGTCHGPDNLIADGFGYSNGATAPTAFHSVRPNFNLLDTDNYFWNGSFDNGSYASLAFAAQVRTNCEIILFATVEGPSSDPDQRIGNPNLIGTGFAGNDAVCRPEPVDQTVGVPPNFFDINGNLGAAGLEIAAQKITAAQDVVARVRLLGGVLADPNIIRDDSDGDGNADANDVSRFVDFYSVSELRLPPNPLKRLWEAGDLNSEATAQLEAGEATYTSAGCNGCHISDNSDAPYADGKNHGNGAAWMRDFLNEYNDDNRVVFANTDVFEDAVEGDNSENDPEINIHLDTDFFRPFCFDQNDCLRFDDPIAVSGDDVQEGQRLNLIQTVNLDDVQRGFVPGNVTGAVRINTPSLRGIWWNTAYLHHGLARTIHEATLPPGHPALRAGELGWAVTSGSLDFNAHGTTADLPAADIDALALFLESIE